MNEKDYEFAEKILNKLDDTSSDILQNYALWFIADAVIYILASVIGLFICLVWIKISKKDDFDGYIRIIQYFIIFCFLTLFIQQIPDLIAPKAKATHQLIKDIRGKNN